MARILSVAYDESLLLTRHYILEKAGFTVVSALRFAEAIEHCQQQKFDLIVLGHSVPPSDKTALIAETKRLCGCPALSIRRFDQPRHPSADYSVESGEGPEALITAINNALRDSPT
jgi:DNA-binding NtrC family response regulator